MQFLSTRACRIICLLIPLFTVIGCGGAADREYVAGFRSIISIRSGSPLAATDPTALKRILTDLAAENTQFIEPIGAVNELSGLISRAKGLECSDPRLLESREYLIAALEGDKKTMDDLQEIFIDATRGVPLDDLYGRLEGLFEQGKGVNGYFQRAKHLVDEYVHAVDQ